MDSTPSNVTTDRLGDSDVYDWWSRHPRALDVLYAFAFLGRERTYRKRALETLGPEPDERILDFGCGPGNSFDLIRSAIGLAGSLVGLDASRGMIQEARSRVRAEGWHNVHVVRGDVLRPPFDGESFDAVYASMSLSAVRGPEEAIVTVETLLRPGGRLVVLDGQPFQQWPWTVANEVIVPVSKRTTDWRPDVDIPSALRRTFATVDVETFNAGTVLLARAFKTHGGRSP